MEASLMVVGSGMWDCGSLLYDSHELVSIFSSIERHMMVWKYNDRFKPVITKCYSLEDVALIQHISKDSSMMTNSNENFRKNVLLKNKLTGQIIKKKHKKVKGSFFGLVCG